MSEVGISKGWINKVRISKGWISKVGMSKVGISEDALHGLRLPAGRTS